MSKKVSPIPRGYRTATPCLTVINVDNAVAFYHAAFGSELLTSHAINGSTPSIHATIKIGNSIIALNQEAPPLNILSAQTSGVSTGQIHLYVTDIEASWNRAIEAGAIVHTPLFDAYWGDRTGMLIDNSGHIWSIASKIENVSKDEVNRRGRSIFDDNTSAGDAAANELPYLVETGLAGDDSLGG